MLNSKILILKVTLLMLPIIFIVTYVTKVENKKIVNSLALYLLFIGQLIGAILPEKQYNSSVSLNNYTRKAKHLGVYSSIICTKRFYSSQNFWLDPWFVGFSEAEGCFKIKPKYREGKSSVHSFNFEFEIHLHIDDLKLLKYISDSLGIGKVYERVNSNSCSFVVGNEKELRILIELFNRHPFNGIKLLDFIDFKKAFFIYFDRPDTLNDELSTQILKLKLGMNKGRNKFVMPENHQVKITKYWLLGLIEGEGSFSIAREKLRPCFQLCFTAAQKPLLEEIKKYLIMHLGFDKFSLWKIKNSSIIGIFNMKAKGNSKPTVSLEIKDIRLLHNYIIPFLNSMSFISKKRLDFTYFVTICQVLYIGAHRDSKIKELIIRHSLTMNDFRLSTNEEKSTNKALSLDELTLLKEVVSNASTRSNMLCLDNNLHFKEYKISSINNVVYIIVKSNKEEIIISSLKEAADIVGVHYTTLSRLLKSQPINSNEVYVNNNLVKKIEVLTGN